MLTRIATPFYFVLGVLALLWESAARFVTQFTGSRRA